MCIGYGDSSNSILKQLQIETIVQKYYFDSYLLAVNCSTIYVAHKTASFRKVTYSVVVRTMALHPWRHAIESLSKQFFLFFLIIKRRCYFII